MDGQTTTARAAHTRRRWLGKALAALALPWAAATQAQQPRPAKITITAPFLIWVTPKELKTRVIYQGAQTASRALRINKEIEGLVAVLQERCVLQLGARLTQIGLTLAATPEQAKYLIVLQPDEGVGDCGAFACDANLVVGVSVIEAASQQRVWRDTFTFHPDFSAEPAELVGRLVEKVVRQLRSDNLMGGL